MRFCWQSNETFFDYLFQAKNFISKHFLSYDRAGAEGGLSSPVIKLAPPPQINKQALVHDLINYSKLWPPLMNVWLPKSTALAWAQSHDETHIEYFGQHILHHKLTQKPILTVKRWVTVFKNTVWIFTWNYNVCWQKMSPHFLLTCKFCALKNDFFLITYHRKTDSLQFPCSQMAAFTVYHSSVKLHVKLCIGCKKFYSFALKIYSKKVPNNGVKESKKYRR